LVVPGDRTEFATSWFWAQSQDRGSACARAALRPRLQLERL